MDWSDSDNFYLISFLLSDTTDIKIYLNDTNLNDTNPLSPKEGRLNIEDATLILGFEIDSEMHLMIYELL